MASSSHDSHHDPFADSLPSLPYSRPFKPPAPSAPPPSRPSSTLSESDKPARWSFLETAEPDLTLSVYSGEAGEGRGGGKGWLHPAVREEEQQREGGGESWSYAAETVTRGERGSSNEGHERGSWDARSEDDRKASGMMVDDSPWTTPEVSQGEFSTRASLAVPATEPDLLARSTNASSLLSVPPDDTLNRSNGSSPDSFVDPYMATALPSSTATSSAPSPAAATPHSTPPASPSFPFPFPPPSPPAAASLAPTPAPTYGSTPSPPRVDLHGRPLPAAPPSSDPFAAALAYRQQQHPSAAALQSSPGKSPRARALGSLRSFTMPFGRHHAHGQGVGQDEDLTASSFASVGTSGGSATPGGTSTGTGYWDTSLSYNVSGVLPPLPAASQPLTSTPTRPPPLTRSHTAPSTTTGEGVPLALLPSPPVPAATAHYPTYSPSFRPLHTVVDLPPLPLTASRSAPSALNSPSSSPSHIAIPTSHSHSFPASPPEPQPIARRASALALRRSVTRPPPAALLLVHPPSSPLSPPPETAGTTTTTATSASGTSSTGSSGAGLRTINRSPDGFYRPSPSALPASPSTHSLLPPPSPHSAGRPHSLYGTLPLSSPSLAASYPLPLSASPELAFPLPPPSSATDGGTGSPSTACHPLNPFTSGRGGRREREGTGGSGWTVGSEGTRGEEGGGRGRQVATPSFVSVFVPPPGQGHGHGHGHGHGRSPFGEDDDDDGDAFSPQSGSIPIYPPRAFHLQHHAGVDSVSSSVAPGAGLDSPRRRTRLVKPEQQTARNEVEKGAEEKKRRTEAWLDGVVAGSSSSVSGGGKSSTAPSAGTSSGGGGGGATGLDRSPSARMRRAAAAAASAVGWSIRGERERLGSVDDGVVGGQREEKGHRRRHYRRGGKQKGLKGWWARRSPLVRWSLLAALVALLILLVGLVVGLSRRGAGAALAAGDCTCLNGGRPSLSADGKGCECVCREGWGGTGCGLNATCVDVGGEQAGGRNWVAKGMVEVAERASGVWKPEVDVARLGEVLATYVLPSSTTTTASGSSSNGADPPSCASHLALLTLPSLPVALYPSRLAWTESALVHTLALTEFNSSLSSLRTFASGLSFAPYGDTGATKPNSNYQAIVGGYMWDLSVMERVALDVGWEKTAGPPSEAVERVEEAGEEVKAALEKVTANAVAASKQRAKALQHYWVDTLGFEADDLDAFRQRVQQAEVVVPLDATATGVFDAATAASGGGRSFPPAVGCVGGVSSEVVERVNEVEQGAFGLAAVQAGQTGNATCVNRPLYGLLNLLNLRLPFPSSDSRTSLPQQSLVLSSSSSITSRISLHAGELLSAGASSAAPSSSLTAPTSIERFGLLSAMDHVLLDYLLLFPSVSTAKLFVSYVLSSSSTPPASSDELFTASNSLASIPQLEVQIWGGVQKADISFARSGLSSSASSSLFFGSPAGSSFRSYALSSSPTLARIEWAPSAESVQVANDTSVGGGGGSAFETVWAGAANGTAKATAVWTSLSRVGVVG
ncbi:hypothetical protein JCM6882_004999 [Rhodosporidiobolus microsporus]